MAIKAKISLHNQQYTYVNMVIYPRFEYNGLKYILIAAVLQYVLWSILWMPTHQANSDLVAK